MARAAWAWVCVCACAYAFAFAWVSVSAQSIIDWTSPAVFRAQLLSALTDSASVRAALTRQLEGVRRVVRRNPPVPEPPPSKIELCRQSGHGDACEMHVVRTDDGFLLNVVRIRAEDPGAPAMLVMHGDVASSDSWMMRKDDSNFGSVLHRAGYDVWIGNFRGSTNAREHMTLNVSNPEFWNWSWHEMGMFDLPNTIDYILEERSMDSLHFAGHSMATSAFLVTMSNRPEYNAKVRSAHLMSPSIRMRGLIRLVSDGVFGNFIDMAERWLKRDGIYDIWPRLALWHYIADIFCTDDSPLINVCYGFYEEVLGKTHPKQRLPNLLPTFGAYHPAGTSLRCLKHYGAVNLHGNFRPLGKDIDDPNPGPDYNLTAITTPIALYYSITDGIISPKDVERLARSLPRVVLKYLIPLKEFNHVDFMWAKDAKELLYDTILKLANDIEARHIQFESPLKLKRAPPLPS